MNIASERSSTIGRWASAAKRGVAVLSRDKAALMGAVFVLFMVLLALFPEFFSTKSPVSLSTDRLHPPNAEYFMGTDQYGRDIFSRVVYASQVSVTVGLMTVTLALLLGIPIGAIAGMLSPRWGDNVIMRIMDVMMAFPPIILAIAVVAALGTRPIEIGPITIPHIAKLMFVIGILYVPQIARIVRSSVLIEKNEQYVLAERALGASETQILFKDVLRNCLSPVMVHATLLVAAAIITEAALSFLGLGIQPPTPSWGGMLSDSRTFVARGEWWLTVFPGLCIFLAVLSLNTLGDSLRDVLDPRQITKREV